MPTPPPSSAIPAPEVQGLSRAAFDGLFQTIYPDLFWYARELTQDAALADDLAQEAFARLWERRDAIDPARSVRTLLFVMVRNLAYNRSRDESRRAFLLAQFALPPPPQGPDAALRHYQLGQAIRAWIRELPPRQQEAFALSRFCDLSHREVAATMGLSVQTVEKHITRALKHLRERLRAFDPELLP